MNIQNTQTNLYQKPLIHQPGFQNKYIKNATGFSQKTWKLATAAVSSLSLGWFNYNQSNNISSETERNLKNEQQICANFAKRFNDFFQDSPDIKLELNINKFNKNHKYLILECMKNDNISISTTLQNIYTNYHLFYNQKIFNHVTNLIQTYPNFPPELIKAALFKCDDLQIKDCHILYNAMDKIYHFNEHPALTVQNIKSQMLKNPERYINGYLENNELKKEKILNFFNYHYDVIYEFVEILGKEAVGVILQKRLASAEDYFSAWKDLPMDYIATYKEVVTQKKNEDKQLDTSSKIELINIFHAYYKSNLPLSDLKILLINNNEPDIKALELNILKNIFKTIGFSSEQMQEIPQQKLLDWDLKYIHKLAESINEHKYKFSEILMIANSYNYKEFIQNPKNNYGKANTITKKNFENNNLDYEKWLNPDKKNEVIFQVKDNDSERLKHLAEKLIIDIEILRKTPEAQIFIDKRFKNHIINGEFFIPNKIYRNKQKFETFLNNLNKELNPIWERAKQNVSTEKQNRATEVLTIQSHINSYLESLREIPQKTKGSKNINWRIRMWDRYPQKDLFQGNYSACCIGMGCYHGHFMIDYLANTMFNMIELVDNDTNKVVGNALCYFVKDNNNNIGFVIDNIEINHAKTLTKENGIKLRDAIVNYVEYLTKDICNKPISIFMGKHFNDVPTSDLPLVRPKISLLGELEGNEIYLDLLNNGNSMPTDKWELQNYKQCSMFKLK